MKRKQKSVGLRIALPNGSLEEGTLRLFEEAGLKIKRTPRKHEATIDSPLVSCVTFMRPQHIPPLVTNEAYDIGICGYDCVVETETAALMNVVSALPIGRGSSNGKAKVVLVAGKEETKTEIPRDTLVLSEYPNLTRGVLGKRVNVRFSYGGTEAHIPNDYRYGVCLTDTGESIVTNRLKVVRVLLSTYTGLFASISVAREKREAIKTLHHLLCGAFNARGNVLLKMNVPREKKDAVLSVLPALKTPTIAPLADGVSFALETVIPKKDANNIIVKVAQAGACGILQIPIAKIIPNW